MSGSMQPADVLAASAGTDRHSNSVRLVRPCAWQSYAATQCLVRLQPGQAVVEVLGGSLSIAAAQLLLWLFIGLRSRRVPLWWGVAQEGLALSQSGAARPRRPMSLEGEEEA